jgi:hypothetical protein
MSVKKAQQIANELEQELGFSLVSYQNADLEFMKNKIEEFLDLEIDTEELEDPDDAAYLEDVSDDDDNIEDFV